jgi:hypothetical protein
MAEDGEEVRDPEETTINDGGAGGVVDSMVAD